MGTGQEPMMTGKQQSYIIRLCNQIAGRQDGHLSQLRDVHGWGSFKMQRGITMAEASAKITEPKERAGVK